MNAGNKFDLLPVEDLKATLSIKKNKGTSKTRKVRNPITGEDLGTIETEYSPYSSLKVSSPCPSYLQIKKKK